jgi:hypothetical protein
MMQDISQGVSESLSDTLGLEERRPDPSGTVLAASRRAEVLSLVTKARAFLVEDDCARDFCFGMPTPPAPLACADTNGHVVYIRSLSKPAASSLRVGALCARGAALARLRLTRYADDFFCSRPDAGARPPFSLLTRVAASPPAVPRRAKSALRGAGFRRSRAFRGRRTSAYSKGRLSRVAPLT